MPLLHAWKQTHKVSLLFKSKKKCGVYDDVISIYLLLVYYKKNPTFNSLSFIFKKILIIFVLQVVFEISCARACGHVPLFLHPRPYPN